MSIKSLLENYHLPILHDSEATHVLSLIGWLGPISDEELKQKVQGHVEHNPNKLIELYKSGFVTTNNKQQWCLGEPGVLALGKVGITQLITSAILRASLKQKANYWLLQLVKDEENIVNSSNTYHRFKFAEWLFENNQAWADVRQKEEFMTCVFFSTKSEIYTHDSGMYYEFLLNAKAKDLVSKKVFSERYDFCRSVIFDSNKLFVSEKEFTVGNVLYTFFVTLVRLVTFIVARRLDFGVEAALGKNVDIGNVWHKIGEWKKDSQAQSYHYLLENAHVRGNKNVLKRLRELATQKMIENQAIPMENAFEELNESVGEGRSIKNQSSGR